MAKATSPFAGIKLSDQTNPSNRKLDQQLFAPSPKQPAPPVIPAQEPPVSGKPDTRNSETPRIRENDTAGAAHHPFVFNVNEAPSIKEMFLITDGEYEGMEDMKLQLRRLLDMKASKQDIIRCAVQHILEDFRKHPEASIIVSRLQQKKK